jgi:hypothetical protein
MTLDYTCRRCGARMEIECAGNQTWADMERLRQQVNAHVCPHIVTARERFFEVLNMQGANE